MTFQEIVSGAQQAVSVLSDPRKSALATAGLSGVVSAEINNLRQQALSKLPSISGKFGPSYQSAVDSLLSPFRKVLGEGSSIPNNSSGTVFGFTYFQVLIAGVAAVLLGIFFIGRGSR